MKNSANGLSHPEEVTLSQFLPFQLTAIHWFLGHWGAITLMSFIYTLNSCFFPSCHWNKRARMQLLLCFLLRMCCLFWSPYWLHLDIVVMGILDFYYFFSLEYCFFNSMILYHIYISLNKTIYIYIYTRLLYAKWESPRWKGLQLHRKNNGQAKEMSNITNVIELMKNKFNTLDQSL